MQRRGPCSRRRRERSRQLRRSYVMNHPISGVKDVSCLALAVYAEIQLWDTAERSSIPQTSNLRNGVLPAMSRGGSEKQI